ncbi:hypothetical protein [Reyranella soli]|jgi:hypothetical protein|uniref:Uncharacterized protein n=1 Tax=Reyranella soli TaxID=1230389 RepID=A0A512NA87_9HYPH|nr:hypothetical protein [Reyranella soli]GEP55863.1 hypothetical protein RSO01_30290 [Reyranella soli]
MIDRKAIAVNGRDYSVTLERFDQDTVSGGPSYHGYYVTIEGHGLTLKARKYDNGSDMSIQSGLKESDSDAIKVVRDIARQIFRTDQLLLLTTDNLVPYKEI